jgi:hypothetical protein
MLRPFSKMDLGGIRGKTVLDAGSNIAINAMLAQHRGARPSGRLPVDHFLIDSAIELHSGDDV